MTWNRLDFSPQNPSFFIRTPHARTHVCRYHDSHFAFILRDEKLEEYQGVVSFEAREVFLDCCFFFFFFFGEE